MHLDLLKLQRFRSCADVSVQLRSDLTVLVGENNGGKSNIVDAIRLLTLPLSGRRERYAEDEDLHRGSADPSFAIEGRFCGLTDAQKGLLISAVPDPIADLATWGLRYQCGTVKTRGKASVWAGRFDTSEPERGATDLVRHVFLPALRDARQALGSGAPTRIATLLKNFLLEGEEADFLAHVRRAPVQHRLVTSVNAQIGNTLRDLTQGVRAQDASLDFTTEALSDVARDLRFKLGDAGIPLEEIISSGLGYANLLYIATVIVELAKAREADLTLFLVEEPEAHLHPQLQMLMLDFLLLQAKKSAEREPIPGSPDGRIQIVVTTHSPNLTAWVAPEHIVVVRSIHPQQDNPGPRRTVVVPIAGLGVSEGSLRKISRYIDVTRSALLFGGRALLVEGIAEALLLPAIAKLHVLHDDNEALQRFRGSVLVPIDGVDFKPYVEVLLRRSNGASVADRVVVMTDRDPQLAGNRADELEQLANGFGARASLDVYTNDVTLEHALCAAGNADLMRDVFLELHPRSGPRWDNEVAARPEIERAGAVVGLFSAMAVRKGDFAQTLADRIVSGSPFVVPDYFRQAIVKVSEA
jgi:putative ATP-dependent endonuclease of the OLD family